MSVCRSVSHRPEGSAYDLDLAQRRDSIIALVMAVGGYDHCFVRRVLEQGNLDELKSLHQKVYHENEHKLSSNHEIPAD